MTVLPSGVADASAARNETPRVSVKARIVDDGDTKITIIRDEDTGQLLLKAATDPSVVIDTTDLIEEGAKARLAPGEADDPGIGVSIETSVASAADAQQAAAQLTRADIDFRKAAVGLQASGPTGAEDKIFDAGCIKVTAGGEAYWKGCFERRRVPDSDPDHWYTLENSWAHGHHDGLIGGIDWAYVANRYYKSSKAVTIIKQRPMTDLDVDDKCEAVQMSLAPEGVGVTDKVRVCPNEVEFRRR